MILYFVVSASWCTLNIFLYFIVSVCRSNDPVQVLAFHSLDRVDIRRRARVAGRFRDRESAHGRGYAKTTATNVVGTGWYE